MSVDDGEEGSVERGRRDTERQREVDESRGCCERRRTALKRAIEREGTMRYRRGTLEEDAVRSQGKRSEREGGSRRKMSRAMEEGRRIYAETDPGGRGKLVRAGSGRCMAERGIYDAPNTLYTLFCPDAKYRLTVTPSNEIKGGHPSLTEERSNSERNFHLAYYSTPQSSSPRTSYRGLFFLREPLPARTLFFFLVPRPRPPPRPAASSFSRSFLPFLFFLPPVPPFFPSFPFPAVARPRARGLCNA